jgi:hypothetical protein
LPPFAITEAARSIAPGCADNCHNGRDDRSSPYETDLVGFFRRRQEVGNLDHHPVLAIAGMGP